MTLPHELLGQVVRRPARSRRIRGAGRSPPAVQPARFASRTSLVQLVPGHQRVNALRCASLRRDSQTAAKSADETAKDQGVRPVRRAGRGVRQLPLRRGSEPASRSASASARASGLLERPRPGSPSLRCSPSRLPRSPSRSPPHPAVGSRSSRTCPSASVDQPSQTRTGSRPHERVISTSALGGNPKPSIRTSSPVSTSVAEPPPTVACNEQTGPPPSTGDTSAIVSRSVEIAIAIARVVAAPLRMFTISLPDRRPGDAEARR